MKVKGFVRSRMRESRTYGSVRGGYRKVSVYSIVEATIMKIDFNDMDSMAFPGMNNGTGTMSARMYNDDSYRIIPTAIHPGGSIGNHKQESGDDMNYIISGTGKAFCDGVEEDLRPGVMHICPKGSEHSIVNTGEEDLIMLTIVVKK